MPDPLVRAGAAPQQIVRSGATPRPVVLPTGVPGPKGDPGNTGPQGPAGAQGPQGPQGPQGSSGAAGATGAQGPTGPAGRSVLSGAGVPSAGTGAEGDFYINLADPNLRIFGPKTGGAWGSGINLVGPQGAAGTNGTNGSNGTNGWSPVLASVSDGARRVMQVVDWQGGTGSKPATGLYIGAAGLTAVLADAVDVRGPQGAAGAAGAGVPTGGTTGQVLKKASNTDHDTVWAAESGGGGGAAALPWTSGRHYTNSAGSAGTGTPPSRYTYATPIYVPQTVTIDQLVAEMTSTNTSQTLFLGIYDTGTDGLPDDLLATTGGIDASTSGVKTGTVNVTLTAGWYWLVGMRIGGASWRAISADAAATFGLSQASTPGVNEATTAYLAADSGGNLNLFTELPAKFHFGNISRSTSLTAPRIYMRTA